MLDLLGGCGNINLKNVKLQNAEQQKKGREEKVKKMLSVRKLLGCAMATGRCYMWAFPTVKFNIWLYPIRFMVYNRKNTAFNSSERRVGWSAREYVGRRAEGVSNWGECVEKGFYAGYCHGAGDIENDGIKML